MTSLTEQTTVELSESTLESLKCDMSAILSELKENDIQIFNMLSEILSILQTFLPAQKVK